MSHIKVYTILATAAATGCCVLIILGGAVCFMGAAKAIPDWPAVFGGITPPNEPGAFVEYLHRAGAVIVGLLIVTLVVSALLWFRDQPWLFIPPLLSLILLVLVSTIGALVVLGSVSPVIAAVDLASALLVLALMVTSTLAGRLLKRNPERIVRFNFHDSFSRLAVSTGLLLYIVLLAGLSVGNPAPCNCIGMPLSIDIPIVAGGSEWLRTAHRLLSGLASALIVSVAITVWIKRRTEKHQLLLASGAGILLIVSLVAGELAASRNFLWSLMAIRVFATALLWGIFTALIVREGLKASIPGEKRNRLRIVSQEKHNQF